MNGLLAYYCTVLAVDYGSSSTLLRGAGTTVDNLPINENTVKVAFLLVVGRVFGRNTTIHYIRPTWSLVKSLVS